MPNMHSRPIASTFLFRSFLAIPIFLGLYLALGPIRIDAQEKPPAKEQKEGDSNSSSGKIELTDDRGSWLKAQDMTGTTDESESAVNLGLRWLADHQYPNGGWSFDHRTNTCKGQCKNPGVFRTSVNGATGLALLPFISHGNTHRSGPFRKNVEYGFRFLVPRSAPEGGYWEEGGRMYSHALAFWAFAEDMRVLKETPDLREEDASEAAVTAAIRDAAARSLYYTVAAQDPQGGGWRYMPLEEGDTSVTGWKVVALNSAAKSGAVIPVHTLNGVNHFLDSVQSDQGASYGYQLPRPTPTCTAIGLLCRIYTGCPRDNVALQAGAAMLARMGPSQHDMYYNYYATLVLHHIGGPLWESWNTTLQAYLIRTQYKEGHERGSWYFDRDPHNRTAGRLYSTALVLLILETPYRVKSVYSTTTTTTTTTEKSYPTQPELKIPSPSK